MMTASPRLRFSLHPRKAGSAAGMLAVAVLIILPTSHGAVEVSNCSNLSQATRSQGKQQLVGNFREKHDTYYITYRLPRLHRPQVASRLRKNVKSNLSIISSPLMSNLYFCSIIPTSSFRIFFLFCSKCYPNNSSPSHREIENVFPAPIQQTARHNIASKN